MNDELIKNICKLPEELIGLIKEYVPKKEFIFTNRENYKLYHHLTPINPLLFHNYICKTLLPENVVIMN